MKLMGILLLIMVSLNIGCSKSSNQSGGGIKDTFFHALQSEPADLHPIRASEVVTSQIILQDIHSATAIIETLLFKNLETHEFIPNLAKSWKVSEDGKQFTFNLRKDVKFHDGTMMTAEDVDFSFKALFDDLYESYPLRSFYSNFVKSKIIDPYTIRFTAKSSYYLNLTVISELRILSKDFYSKQTKDNRLAKTIVGTGPYKLKKWNKGKNITLVQFDDWWGKKDSQASQKYQFKQVVFKFIKEANLRRAMLERGKLDYDNDVRAEDFVKKMNGEPWGKSVLKVKAKNKLPKNMSFIGLNNKNKILKDKNVRIALAHLVNRAFINEKFYYDMNVHATGPFRIDSDYSNPQTKAIKFDPKKAKEILNQAGWSDSDKDGVLDKVIDGEKTSFVFNLLNANKDTEKVITVIKEDMKKAGVRMVIETIDWNAFTKALDERKFDSVIMRWGSGGIDPDPTQIWHTKSAVGTGSNFVSYSNPKVDTLIESAINITDREKRVQAFHKIHSMIAADAPYIFFFEPKYSIYAVSSRVKRPKDTLNYSIGPQYWALPE